MQRLRVGAALGSGRRARAAVRVIGLLGPELINRRETPDLYPAAVAKDRVNLGIVSRLKVVPAVWASQGSRRSWQCLIDC